jgi:putative acetyltransferase
MKIRPALPADIPEVRTMLAEYVAWIGLDLAFQEIDAELAGLPGEYAPPHGALLVAEDEGRLLGMIGLRPLVEAASRADLSAVAQSTGVEAHGEKAGEMKRLFVRPAARGRGLAKQLIAQLLLEANSIGYTEIRLDTLPMMGDAQSLYVSLGFHDIPAYYDTPIAGTRFMALRLRSEQALRLPSGHANRP